MKKLIDLTHEITYGLPVYPGDKKTMLCQTQSLDIDGYNSLQQGAGCCYFTIE